MTVAVTLRAETATNHYTVTLIELARRVTSMPAFSNCAYAYLKAMRCMVCLDVGTSGHLRSEKKKFVQSDKGTHDNEIKCLRAN
jgi:hypothetical protein